MKSLISTLTALVFLFTTPLCADEMPEPFASAETYPFDDEGAFHLMRIQDELMSKYCPKTVVDLYSWLGKSTRYFGRRTKETGGKVYAIDTWTSHPDGVEDPDGGRLAQLYPTFLSNIVHADLTENVFPIPMDPQVAARLLDQRADLIYFNTTPSKKNVAETIEKWFPHLNSGGLFCGDHGNNKYVFSAVKEAATNLGFEAHRKVNFWWFGYPPAHDKGKSTKRPKKPL